MDKLKVLNLYAGLGGNRKLWKDVDVTAVEHDKATAKVYQEYFPNDTVIVGDAHQYLLEHYKEYDFIWSSPPCPTHSDIRRCGVNAGQYEAKYPSMDLYQQIILLQNFIPKKSKFVVENVRPYYPPLIPPTKKLHRHLFWANFRIGNTNDFTERERHINISNSSEVYGISLKETDIEDKRKALRNMVDPKLGLYILNRARGIIQKSNTKQMNLL